MQTIWINHQFSRRFDYPPNEAPKIICLRWTSNSVYKWWCSSGGSGFVEELPATQRKWCGASANALFPLVRYVWYRLVSFLPESLRPIYCAVVLCTWFQYIIRTKPILMCSQVHWPPCRFESMFTRVVLACRPSVRRVPISLLPV